jgi:hypothetical protein
MLYAVFSRSIPRASAEYVWKTPPSSLAKTLMPSRYPSPVRWLPKL